MIFLEWNYCINLFFKLKICLEGRFCFDLVSAYVVQSFSSELALNLNLDFQTDTTLRQRRSHDKHV